MLRANDSLLGDSLMGDSLLVSPSSCETAAGLGPGLVGVAAWGTTPTITYHWLATGHERRL